MPSVPSATVSTHLSDSVEKETPVFQSFKAATINVTPLLKSAAPQKDVSRTILLCIDLWSLEAQITRNPLYVKAAHRIRYLQIAGDNGGVAVQALVKGPSRPTC